jgi:phage repressor protein C with HTH and peptisase S24 domain
MLIDNVSFSTQSRNEESSTDDTYTRVGYDRDDKRLQILVVTSSHKNKENIVLVPREAEAGYSVAYKDSEFISKLPSFSLPGFDEGIYRAFCIRGNSMESTIKTGDWVVGRYVPNLKQVQLGSICIVVLRDDGFICKRVEKHFKNGITLHSDNKDYQPIQPLAEDIVEIWEAKAIIRMIY